VPQNTFTLPFAVPTASGFSRPNWAEIDLDALRHNARVLWEFAAPAGLVAVAKAGAYGHGAAEIARALQGEPGVALFGVACVEEGVALREAGVEMPILLLSAILPDEAPAVVEANLVPTVWSQELASALDSAAAAQGTVLEAHFKVDTGMGRLGVGHCEAAQRYRDLRAYENLRFTGMYTHLACADEQEDRLSGLQLERFEAVLGQLSLPPEVLRHAANSAATLRYPEAHYDLVRPGLALYGTNPCPGLSADLPLRPVMTWKARITNLKTVAAGETVSYGGTWRAMAETKIAIIPCGYADGYFRALSNRGEVLVNGERCKVVGRVTMDQILVDVTGLKQPARLGDGVTLFGVGLPVEEVAASAGTIPWELLCAVSQRVARVYV